MNLYDNPFYILGVNTTSSRAEIDTHADETLLFEDDHEKVINARATLTNPRRRLEAELAWLTDLTEPEKAYKTVKRSRRSLTALTDLDVDTPLATLNALTHAFNIDKGESLHSLYHWIGAILYAEQHLDKAAIFREINRTREIINVPTVKDWDVFEAAYDEHLQSVARTINAILKQASEKDLVEALDAVINFPLLVHAKSELLAQIFDAAELRVLPRFKALCQKLELLTASHYTDEEAELVGQACVQITKESRALSMPFVGWARVRCLSCRPSVDVIERARQLLWSLSNSQKNRVSAKIAKELTEVYKTSPTVVRLFNHDLEIFNQLALIEAFTSNHRETQDEEDQEDDNDEDNASEAQSGAEDLTDDDVKNEDDDTVDESESETSDNVSETMLWTEEEVFIEEQCTSDILSTEQYTAEKEAEFHTLELEQEQRSKREAKREAQAAGAQQPVDKRAEFIEAVQGSARTQGFFVESQLGDFDTHMFKRQFEQDVNFYAKRYGLDEEEVRRILVDAHMEECLKRFDDRQANTHDDLRPFIDWMKALKEVCHDAKKRNDITSTCLKMKEYRECANTVTSSEQPRVRHPQYLKKKEDDDLRNDKLILLVFLFVSILISIYWLSTAH